MGDPNTGDIYRLGMGRLPEPGHVPLTEEEAARLERMDATDRIAELKRMASSGGAAVAPAPGGKYAVDDTTRARLENTFTYHPPHGDQAERYMALRQLYLHVALTVCQNTPPGREQALALTKLEESCFWTNAAIARNE